MKVGQKRLLNPVFEDKDVVLWDVMPIEDGETILVTFESINSEWQQGVELMCDKGVEVADSECALNRRDSVAGESKQWICLSFDSVPPVGVGRGDHLRPDEVPGYPDYLLYRGPAPAYEKDFIVLGQF